MIGKPLPYGAAVIVLGPSALPLARQLVPILPGAAIHAMDGKGMSADRHFARAADHIAFLFAEGTPIVGLCAAGILIRAVAPLLADKQVEPPVLAIGEDGASIVPLLGGHHGANAMAQAIAGSLGGHAALTTAGELAFGLALDDPPPGWRIADRSRVKPVTAALLAGTPVALAVEAVSADWLTESPIAFADWAKAALRIRVTDRHAAPGETDLIFYPPVLVLGVGCERGCDPAELRQLAEETLTEQGLAAESLAAVVSLDLKADEPAVHDLATHFDIPARFFTAASLAAETPRLATPSDSVFRETGCYGVAEGAALAAVGPAGALIVAKRKSQRATCAIAKAPAPLDPARFGAPRGALAIIGIGPGDPAWRTPEADAALAAAEEIVGYQLYLDLLGSAIAGKRCHESALGAEEARARRALDLAASGRKVALVSSGDAGIYGLATLVFELLDRENRADWRRIALSVIPGLSALQAAASRAGAPLGHDFCTISLSDLLTPWPSIEKRLRAAGEGDFVVALYNPRSQRRRDQLVAARAILLEHRGPQTPVVLARNLGRAEEAVTITTLGALDCDAVDMLTILLIGNSQTRRLAGDHSRLYTPRGYAGKQKPEAPR